MRGSTSVYCSLLRHEALERSILWLTGKGISHAPPKMGCRPESEDRHSGSSGQTRGGSV